MPGIQPSNGVAPGNTTGGILAPNLAAGCDNLWYAPRCNPRLDPFAMNAMISEIINAVNGSCGCDNDGTFTGLPYDCNVTDNLCRAIRNHITQYFFDCCLPENFPLVNNACTIEQLVLQTDATGCRRIARYTDASSVVGSADASSVYPIGTDEQIPNNPNNQANYYQNGDLFDDYLAGTIDEGRLANTLLIATQFTLDCDAEVELCFSGEAIFDPQADGGAGRRSAIIMRIDGEFPNNTVVIIAAAAFTNFERSIEGCLRQNLTAGTHTVQVYVVRQAGLNGAQVGVTLPNANAIRPDLIIRVAQQ